MSNSFKNFKNFFSNTGIYSTSIIIEGIMIFIFCYAIWQAILFFFLGTDEENKISICINKLLMSSSFYYILKFLEIFLIQKYK